MSSMIEYIRQINQNSVSLKPEWLERLKNVDAGPDAAVLLPEIVLTEAGAIPGYSEGKYEAPVTMVKQNANPAPTQTIQPGDGGPSGHPSADSDTRSPQSSMQNIDDVQLVSATGIEELGAQLFDEYSNQIDATAMTTPPNGTLSDSMASGMTSPDAAIDATPKTTASIAEPADHRHSSIREAIVAESPSTDSEPEPPASQLLETPAVLTDIVRPTIMPLRQQPGPGVLDAGPDVSRHPVPASQPTQTANSQEPPSQIVQIIHGLEGTAFGDISNNDTVPSSEWRQPVSNPAPATIPATTTGSGDLNPATMSAVQPEPIQMVSPLIQSVAAKMEVIASASETSQSPTAAPTKLVIFPTDKRAEQFHFDRSKKQKLVNGIVDQVVDRFPAAAPATILLIGASGEIDVDSAASRIATCMATRDLGDILLVDANLRTRQLSSLLGIENAEGISDAFLRNEPAIQLVSETDNANLMVLGSGTRDLTSDAVTLPCSNATNDSLRQEFQYTIISGGIAGDKLTDAWSGIVDGVYLIVDMDESDRNSTIATVDYFRQLGARIVGCIATRSR